LDSLCEYLLVIITKRFLYYPEFHYNMAFEHFKRLYAGFVKAIDVIRTHNQRMEGLDRSRQQLHEVMDSLEETVETGSAKVQIVSDCVGLALYGERTGNYSLIHACETVIRILDVPKPDKVRLAICDLVTNALSRYRADPVSVGVCDDAVSALAQYYAAR